MPLRLRALPVGLAVLALVVAAASGHTPDTPPTPATPANPLQGVWSLTAVDPGEGSAVIDPSQPGLYIFTEDYYSGVYAPGAESRVPSAAPFEPTYHLGQQVTGLNPGENGRWLLETSKGIRIDAGAVIIAAGVGAFGPNRPPLDNIEEFEAQGAGQGVHYLVKRRDDFAGRNVVIAGGGDSAVDWALSLADIAKIERSSKMSGRRMTMMVIPLKSQ